MTIAEYKRLAAILTWRDSEASVRRCYRSEYHGVYLGECAVYLLAAL